ncbi:MAG: universal stress protein [Candidatus Nitrosocosmicus sp.]
MKLPLSRSMEKTHGQGKEIVKEDTGSIEGKVRLKKILVPIDGSNYSMRAAKYAVELSKLQNAQLDCIHVISKLPLDYEYTVPTLAGASIQTYIEDIKKHAQEWFNQVNKMASDEGVASIKTDVFIDVKSIADSIINYATNNSVDLIVIGTKGRTGLERFLLGSVAQGVKQHAHCPVLLVR